MKSLFICLAILITTLSYAQEPVSWKFSADKIADDEYLVTATATIDNGWYLYSQYLESDNGPIATAIVIESSHKSAEKATESGKKISGFDKMFDMNITKYKQQMMIQIFPQPTSDNLKSCLVFRLKIDKL